MTATSEAFSTQYQLVLAPSSITAGRLYAVSKRLLDIVVSVVLLVLSAWLIALLAIIIRLDSSGPAIFRQERVGKDGRPFRFYKFRTMHVDARERCPELYVYDYDQQELPRLFFKLAEDPRLTRFGKWLRRTSLDELPNLINVLRGEMSLVGPRPEIPEMVRYYRPDELVKFSAKPGLTGLAQVSGRNILKFQQTIERDVEYMRRRSFWFDLWILARTPVVVVRMLGAL